jgi:hypothetical protein
MYCRSIFLAGLFLSLHSGAPAQDCPCELFPADNVWNTPIEHLPRHWRSEQFIDSIGADTHLHPDFGTEWEGAPIGIPFVVVPASQPLVNVTFDYDDESDPGPYPIPANPPIEGGDDGDGDRHVLVVREGECKLYELFDAHPNGNGTWSAGSGAIYDLSSHALRPETWTSADAAGLPILPGLVRYEEVMAGEINHAIRFTARRTQRRFDWPARHYASNITDPSVPPMGQRFKLKSDFDISGFSPEVQVILRAMRKYGIILADNGSDWYISGVPNPLWDDDVLRELRQVHGRDFEAVDTSFLMLDPDSGEARQGPLVALPIAGHTNAVLMVALSLCALAVLLPGRRLRCTRVRRSPF